MNHSETARLLTAIAAFNNRTIGEADVEAWQSVLPDISLTDAMEAVRQHYSKSTEWLMPAHIRGLVGEIERVRQAAAAKWAPGQAGVPKESPMPEIAGPIRAEELSAKVLDLLAQLRASLPDGSRESLMPRRVHWEREHAAFTRQAEPNPHYRPEAVSARQECRESGPHDDGTHIGSCPDAKPGTGILPDAYRCAGCSFVTASPMRWVGHAEATGHEAEGE